MVAVFLGVVFGALNKKIEQSKSLFGGFGFNFTRMFLNSHIARDTTTGINSPSKTLNVYNRHLYLMLLKGLQIFQIFSVNKNEKKLLVNNTAKRWIRIHY
jgi:hypothetical protein